MRRTKEDREPTSAKVQHTAQRSLFAFEKPHAGRPYSTISSTVWLAFVILQVALQVPASALPRASPLIGGSPASAQSAVVRVPDLSDAAFIATPVVVTIVSESASGLNDSKHHASARLLSERSDPVITTASGVVVDPRGYILTNYHVVKGSVRLRIPLSDRREVIPTLVATDPHTDLAVLKVEEHALSFIPMGNSDELRVGEWILVIGSPFGGIFDRTVTAGIVSAKDRSRLPILGLEDLIQIDAPINPGNSGGALVNARGELVGIINATVNVYGAWTGIGFAIPINRARPALKSVIAEGRLPLGFIGVYAQDLTAELAEALSVPASQAALVSSVLPDSPADEAGLQKGDAVIAFNQKPIQGVAALRRQIAETLPGTTVRLKFYRHAEPKWVKFRVGIRQETLEEKDQGGLQEPTVKQQMGLTLQTLTTAMAELLGYSGLRGLVVLDVVPGSEGYRAGLKRPMRHPGLLFKPLLDFQKLFI